MAVNMDTFFGKLVQSECDHDNCNNCLVLEYENYYLKQKVRILENIVDTSQVIAEINQTLLSNHDQSMNQTAIHQLHSDVGVQTDSQSNPSLVHDGIFDVPNSCDLIDSTGKVEGPDSLFSFGNGHQMSNFDDVSPIINSSNSDCDTISVSPVSSIAVNNLQDALNLDLIRPSIIIDDCPFDKFSEDTLLRELTFTHLFGNRKAVYFGQFPYRYNGGAHEAKDVPQGSYLAILCSYLDVLLPDYEYNSVLINFYENGNCFIPLHSDSEDCIEEDSNILTVSLGAIRTVKFCNSISGEEAQTMDLRHGELTAMTKLSQKLYKHEVLPDPMCTEKRVSLTFRLVKPEAEVPSRDTNSKSCHHVSNPEPSGYVPFRTNNSAPEDHSLTPKTVEPTGSADTPPQAPANVLYISSSMFRFIDTKKLSSEHVNAEKLFYPGADASVMLSKLKRDLNSVSATPSSIFIMCGTNNVNSIYFGSSSLHDAFSGISELLNYLKKRFPSIPINILNILPRASKGRNDVVNELNKYLEEFCCKNSQCNFLGTKNLFNLKDGSRINRYFVPSTSRIMDNCHLNTLGVSRLGKFIKYWTHNLLKLN